MVIQSRDGGMVTAKLNSTMPSDVELKSKLNDVVLASLNSHGRLGIAMESVVFGIASCAPAVAFPHNPNALMESRGPRDY